ncbi:MAG: CBS domain-containing protein [Candidatus Thorarchaeota archaeon]
MSDESADVRVSSEVSRLIQLRLEARLTQSELAKAVGVSQAYIARIERGTLDPKLSIVARITDHLTSQIASRRYRGRFRDLTCSEIMTPNPMTIDARDPASRAVEIMLEHSYSQIPVLRGNSIVGLLTEYDIIKDLHHDLSQMSVQAVMSPESPPVVSETTLVTDVIPLFEAHQAVLVQNQGRLSGIVTRADLLGQLS